MSITISEHHARLVAETATYEAKMQQAGAKTRAIAAQIATAFENSQARTLVATSRIADQLHEIGGRFSTGKVIESIMGGFGVGSATQILGTFTASLRTAIEAEEKATMERARRLNDALRNLFLERQGFTFEGLTPEEQREDLAATLGRVDADLKGYAQSVSVIRQRLSKITISSPTGAFAVKFGKGGEYKELKAELDKYQTRVAETERERISLVRRRDGVIKAIEASEAEREKRRQAAIDAEIEDETKGLSVRMKEIIRYEEGKTKLARAAFEDRNKHELELAKAHRTRLDAILNRATNDYQRRGLQLGAARQDLFSVPSSMLEINRPMPQIMPTVLAPNNAGREDVKQLPGLLRGIKDVLVRIEKKETGLA